MAAPQLRPVVIASEGDVTAGKLEVNDAYDLTLQRLPNGNYELLVFMKIQFFFDAGSGGAWTDRDQRQFVQDWRIAITNAWSGRNIHRTKAGKSVSLRFDFELQTGGWMLDHWEITVTRIAAGSFRTSYVNPAWGTVVLDSEDLSLTPKGHGQTQRGVVHEFGHMLGLADEYPATHTHHADHPSVMNRGESVRARHGDTMHQWVIRKLAERGIQ